ncbi:DUF3039 domain-containing protein [Rhodococcus daqingensis]|uniref:DUF3039 domain-containing protein n=1 Tax=Rhodococcus daqingensis TaxID=2479363 RepID=A0ABW2S110_9NOCA
MLRDDLVDGWDDPACQRRIAAANWDALHPLAELAHPVIAKAAELYGSDPDNDPTPQPIASASDPRLLKFRLGQWRAAIWSDPDTGVRWLCAAGLAKGGHRDRDDFYEQIADRVQRGHGSDLLPTEHDRVLLRRETATWLLTEWELHIQSDVAYCLVDLAETSVASFRIRHPTRNTDLAFVTVKLTVDAPHMEEFQVDIDWRSNHQGSHLGIVLVRRVLTSIAPSAQEWDVHRWSYSQIVEYGHRARRVAELHHTASTQELLAHDPGSVSHYVHTLHIARSSVEGGAIRALCGVFFVVTQDRADKDVCPACQEQIAMTGPGNGDPDARRTPR